MTRRSFVLAEPTADATW